MTKFQIKLNKILLLDGATGTELQKYGLPHSTCPEEWILKNPHIIAKIQTKYVNAGSNAILVPSFGANPFKLAEFGLENQATQINRELAKLTIRNAPKNVLVGGNIGPTGKLLKPSGSLDFEEAVNAFKVQTRALASAGVHFFLIETMMDIQEARAALIAVKETSKLPVIVSMTFSDNHKTLTGTPPDAAVVILQSLGANAVGANCSLGPDSLIPIIREMKKVAKVPIVVKPNAGLPKFQDGKTIFDMSPEQFANFAPELIKSGASIIGGCCGTTPEHIKKVAEKIKNLRPQKIDPEIKSALASPQKIVSFNMNNPLIVIGERINPTGKKILKEELQQGIFKEVRRLAVEQEANGADILDVNVGAPNSNEEKNLAEAVTQLSYTTSLPLCLDSSNSKAIENALRIYPGRALINSISGEKHKISKLLPVAAKYGAMFILLPLDSNQLPETALKRISCAKKILKRAKKFGFSKYDILIDGLVMSVSTSSNAPIETLKTIKWAYANKFLSVAGVSNISFGLPAREKINSAFLSMAIANGLSSAILNPEHQEIISAKFASDMLSNRINAINLFTKKFSSENQTNRIIKPESVKNAPTEELIKNAILTGDREHIEDHIKNALNSSISPTFITEQLLIPTIREVGNLYETKKIFLPQLILSAETVKKAFSIVEPLLESKEDTGKNHQKRVIIATVHGDIHDIGKNIVTLMLKNHGYNVLDLGKDVPAEKIIESVQKFKPDVIALSALMTTTLPSMRTTIEKCRAIGIDCLFLVGGAVLDKNFAQSIDALYAKDAVEAVKLLDKIFNKKY